MFKKNICLLSLLLSLYFAKAQSNCAKADTIISLKEVNAFQYFDYNQAPGVNRVNSYLLARISELMYNERLDFELRKLKNPTGFPSANFESKRLNSSSNRNFECDFSKRVTHWFYNENAKPVRPMSIKGQLQMVNQGNTKPVVVENNSGLLKDKPTLNDKNPAIKNPADIKSDRAIVSSVDKYLQDSIAFEKSKPKFKFINKTDDFVRVGGMTIIPGFDPELMVVSTEDYIILAWRGTDDIYNGDMWEWVGTDAYFLLVNGDGPLANARMHAGMWNSFKLVRTAITRTLDQFEAKTKNKKIFITGHSLGGGMAIISAPYLKGLGYNIGEVYTFASPRIIGDQGFLNKCNSLLGRDRIQRFEYGVDFVTKLWSPALYASDYKIPGHRHWLNQLGKTDAYDCEERRYPMTLNPIEYAAYDRTAIDKLNGDIGGLLPGMIFTYLVSTLFLPEAPRPMEIHGYALLDCGQHNPQYYVKKMYENIPAAEKAKMPPFQDNFPYVYPSVSGNK